MQGLSRPNIFYIVIFTAIKKASGWELLSVYKQLCINWEFSTYRCNFFFHRIDDSFVAFSIQDVSDPACKLTYFSFAETASGYCRCTDTEDRKSTRLNSSHVKIAYAVFCLKKKNKQ